MLGARTLLRDRGLRLPAAVLLLLGILQGASEVLVVLITLRLLGLEESSAAYLNATWGAAAIAGGLMLTILLNRKRLVAGLATGATVLAAGLLMPAAAPAIATAFGGLMLFGVGYALVEAASHTLMHRAADEEAVGRIRGVFESARLTSMAVGAFLVPTLADSIGLRWTMVAAAVLLPSFVLIRLPQLREFEVGAPLNEHQYELLRSAPIFAPLTIATLELLCNSLEPMEVREGSVVIKEGDVGELFYLIDTGRVEVFEGDVKRREQGPGESFGEIALLRDIPRTATVRAVEDTHLLALNRDSFIGAVTGHERSSETAHKVAASRLGGSPPD